MWPSFHKEARNPDKPSSSIDSRVPPALLGSHIVGVDLESSSQASCGLVVTLAGGPLWAASRASCWPRSDLLRKEMGKNAAQGDQVGPGNLAVVSPRGGGGGHLKVEFFTPSPLPSFPLHPTSPNTCPIKPPRLLYHLLQASPLF